MKTCENCPNLLLENAIEQRGRLDWDQELNFRALNSLGWREIINGRRQKIKEAIAVTERLQATYEVLAPDAVIEATEQCKGPFERTTEVTDSIERTAIWLEKVCGAEVAAQISVSGMRNEQDFS